jgi:hypothetical protein
MPALAQAKEPAPDRPFLLWILAGLVAATIGSGATAVAVALTTAGGF